MSKEQSGKQPCPNDSCPEQVSPEHSYCPTCGADLEAEGTQPSKQEWLMALIVHVGHSTGKYMFTTAEVKERTNNSVSEKTIRRVRDRLVWMGLVAHEDSDKKWYFKPNEP